MRRNVLFVHQIIITVSGVVIPLNINETLIICLLNVIDAYQLIRWKHLLTKAQTLYNGLRHMELARCNVQLNY